MISFRAKIMIFAILVVIGGSYLILKGTWPLDKAGQTITGMNLSETDDELADAPPPERSRDMFHHYDDPVPMPQISFYAADDEIVDLRQFRGRKLVVNLWATWCAPCVDELPYLDNLGELISPYGMEVIAISLDRRKNYAEITRFLRRLNVENLTPYLDADGEFMRNLEIRQFPMTLMLNENGEIIAQYQGPLKWDDPAVVRALSNL